MFFKTTNMHMKKRIKLYHQLESTDCGPACIQMLANFYGKKYALRTIKELCGTTCLGTSVRNVVKCCEAIGFDVKAVKVNISETQRMPMPAILFFKKGHFVVLESIGTKKSESCYHIADPDYGKVKMDEDTLKEHLATVCSRQPQSGKHTRHQFVHLAMSHTLWSTAAYGVGTLQT